MRLTLILLLMLGNNILHAQDKAPTNKHFWHSEETNFTPDNIWNVWIDVNNWKNWDTGLKDPSIVGEFGIGAKGTIISLEGRKSKFKVIAYEEGTSYTYKTKLPLGSLYVKRYLKKGTDSTNFTHEVWFKGLSSGIFAKAFGQKFRNMLPEVLLNIKKIIEEDDSN